jgi:glycosyltransferase involved in cell wall biosynthesis
MALRVKADLYHVHSWQFLVCGLALKLMFRKHVVYDMFEDFPSMVLCSAWIPSMLRAMISRVIYVVERFACGVLDGIVTADPGVLRTYSSSNKVIGKAKRVVFYNFPAEWFWHNGECDMPLRLRKYDIVYCGGISQRTGVLVILEAVDLIVRAGIRPKVLLVGYWDSPTFVAEFKANAVKRCIGDCFEILGRVGPFEVPSLICQARIGVIPLQPIPKFLKNIPTKMFEYFACGLAVVASNLPPIKLFLREGEFGHLVDPTDSVEFANGIASLLVDRDCCELMGRRARSAVVRTLNAEWEHKRLLGLYLRILGSRFTPG